LHSLCAGYNLSYTVGMKTAISIPDDVFEQAERYAKRLGVSRSELYARAVRLLLEAESEKEIRASYDRAFGPAAGDDEAARFTKQAARDALAAVEWE
jgi:antitoxin MazE6